ncbi:MAG TPA: biopolymer transporter ExbD [Bacteroidales bacterium]|nr:biopolymer transporter ExbD [Bacteroidales bacterium]
MAEIIQNEGGKQKGKKRSKRHSTHIDMTPMVDLACLLLTFFMLTTAFSKAKVMEIVLPEKVKDPKTAKAPEVDDKRALNIILVEGDKVLWYNGLANPAKPPLPTLNVTDFSDEGIRRVLLQRNKDLFIQIEEMNIAVTAGTLKLSNDTITARRKKMMTKDVIGPVVLIKAADNVKYRNIVDIIDEMAITNIARYALIDINDVEKKMVADYLAATGSNAASNK